MLLVGDTANSDARRIRGFLRATSVYNGVRRCGDILPLTGFVSVSRNENGGAFRGVRHCGNFWVCPDCARATTQKRFDQVRQVLAGVAAEGHSIEFITLTVAHYKREKLAALLEVVQEAWKLMRRKNARDLKGWKYIRALEIKWSFQTGWHVHFHAACWGAARGSVANWIEEEWVSAVRRCGGRASADGQLVKPVERVAGCAQYLTKEMTLTATKEGDSLHPFEILRAAARGDKRMSAVWREYEDTLHARKTRWLVFSTGLLPAYVDLDAPAPDERVLGIIPHDSFVQLAQSEREVILKLLASPISDIAATENVREFLSWLHLEFLPPDKGKYVQERFEAQLERRERPRFERYATWSRRGGRDEWVQKNSIADEWFAAIEAFHVRSEIEGERLAEMMKNKRRETYRARINMVKGEA